VAITGTKADYHGLPEEFCCYYGTLEDIRRKLGLDANGIRHAVETILMQGGKGRNDG